MPLNSLEYILTDASKFKMHHLNLRHLWSLCFEMHIIDYQLWRHGVVVITTAQLPSTKPKLRFWAGSYPALDVSEICDGENL